MDEDHFIRLLCCTVATGTEPAAPCPDVATVLGSMCIAAQRVND
jgi:hypothetical protein